MDLSEVSGTNQRRHPWEVARARFFRRVLQDAGVLAAPRAVLDVGSGDGYLARELLDGLPEGSQDGYIALLDLVIDGHGARIRNVRYVPTWTDHSDYEVLPVGPALEKGEADAASLEASYNRTVEAVGRKPATPDPAKLP